MIADILARWILILFVGFIPLFVLPVSWASVNESKFLLSIVVVAAVLLVWAAGRLLAGGIALPRNILLFAAALLPLAYVISALASGASANSYASGGNQDTVAAMTVLFALLALCALVFSTSTSGEKSVVAAVRALLIAAGAVVMLQIARLFAPSLFSLGGALSGSASSVIGSWHDLGIFLACVVILTCVLWSVPQIARGAGRPALVALGALSFVLLVVLSMTDVWYALAATVGVLGFYQWGNARIRERRTHTEALWRAAVPFVVGVLAVAAAFGGPLVVSRLPASLQITQTEVRPSWQGTFEIGQQVFKSYGPIFGSGPNTFTRAWGQFKPSGINQTQFWSVDFATGIGLIPTSLVTAGALGLVAWLALLSALLVRLLRFVRHEHSPRRALLAALYASAVFLLVSHVVYVPGIVLSILLFALLGMCIALEATGEQSTPLRFSLQMYPRIGIVRILMLLGLVALIGSTCVYAARAALSDMVVAKAAADYNAGGTIAHSLELVQRALVMYPNNDAAHRAAIELGLLQLQQLVAAGEKTNAADLQATLSRTIAEGLQAVSINSGNYQNWLALAQLYQSLGGVGVEGAYQNALSAYGKAASANPTNPLPLVGAAQTAAALGDATSSISYLGKAIALKPNLAAAYYLRSQLEGGQGDFVHGVQDAKAAVSLAQQDPLGWYNLGVILYFSGDATTSAQALSQAVSLNTTYANALFVLSLAYDNMGEHDRALAAIEQVVQLNPQDSTALQVLTNLQAGKPALTLPSPARTNGEQ